MRMIDYLDRGAAHYPDRICLLDELARIEYRTAVADSHRIGRGLLAAELSPGAKAAVLSPNDARAFQAVLGILRAAMTWIPLNARNLLDENIYFLTANDCEFLFFHSQFEQDVARIRREAPGLKGLVCLDRASEHAPSLADWMAEYSTGGALDLRQAPDDVAAILSTGGTTGRPKGVMLTHLNFETMSANFLACMPITEPPVYLVAAPMTHAAGLTAFPLIAMGATNVILAKPEPEAILEAIPRHRVSHLFLPPTVIYMLLAHPRVREYDYRSLRNFLYAAAPMSVDKLKQAMSIFGPVMTQTFGQAESPMICTYMSPQDHLGASDARLASCGRATPFTQVGIMDDDGHLLPCGERGEIVVRGNLVMKGYYKNPDATAEASRHGWHHTGDIGQMDEAGYLYIVDRKKDMIISGGFNIYPSEIEQVIWSHPAVQDCAVIGVPDDKWGEAVKAVVELKPGATATIEQLLAHCRQHLGGMKTPKSIELTPGLPRSPVGKVLKKELRLRYWEGHSRKI
ncbi:MAG: AMP-binding protein [Rhodocyclaceae bacterium]|nr:AMP-binding protein [Rhodocyclaceae bacterium]